MLDNIKTLEPPAKQVLKRGGKRTQYFPEWFARFAEELGDKWANLHDFKKKTNYATTTVRIKFREAGYRMCMDTTKQWFFLIKKEVEIE